MSLTSQRLEQLRHSLSKYPPDNPAYIFTLGNKQSTSSLFANERILYIDLKLKTINYANLGKEQPFLQGRIPQAKGSINMGSSTFKYLRVKQKEPTIKLWEQKSVEESSKKLQEWKFQLYDLDVLLELINLINYIYNSSRSTPKPITRSQVEEVQPISKQNKQEQLAPNSLPNANMRAATLYTPSTQKIVSQVQSPIHKLQNLDNNDNKFKYSEAYQNQNSIKQSPSEHKLPPSPDGKVKDGKANSLHIQQKNKFKGSALSEPDHLNKNNVQSNQREPPSKEQESYYDPNLAPHSHSHKTNVVIPPLKMSKLQHNSSKNAHHKQQQNYNEESQENEDEHSGKIITPSLAHHQPRQQEQRNQSKTHQSGKGKDRTIKNPLQIQISSVQYYEDKENQQDEDGFGQIRGQIQMQPKQYQYGDGNYNSHQNAKSNLQDSIGSFGQTVTKKDFQSENVDMSQKQKKNLDLLMDDKGMFKSKQPQHNQKASIKKKKVEANGIINWNRMFYESSYSIQIYQKFTDTCQKIFKEVILASQLVEIILSAEPITTLSEQGIKFSIYKNTWLPEEERPKPAINFKQLKTTPPFQHLAHLYQRIHNERESIKNWWESNRYVTEKLLNQCLERSMKKEARESSLIGIMCTSMSCQIEYLGFLVMCQAELPQELYTIMKNWQTMADVRKILGEIQLLINLEIPNSTFEIYQRKYTTIPSYILHIKNPIQLMSSSKDSVLTSYINFVTLEKNLPTNTHPAIVFSTLSARGLQESIESQMHHSLSKCLNKGYEIEKMGKIFALCGSLDYYQLLQCYNVGKDRIYDLYENVDIDYYRQLIVSQLCADAFATLLVYAFHQEIPLLSHATTLIQIEDLYRELAFVWLNNLLSFNGMPSTIIWNYISQVVMLTYGIECGDKIHCTLPGYVLDFATDKIGIKLSYYHQKKQEEEESRAKAGKRDRSRSRSRVSQIIRNNYQFPLSLGYSYVQSNILKFIQPKDIKMSQDDDIQVIQLCTKLMQYRASKFALIFSILEDKVTEKLLQGRHCSKHNLISIRGTAAKEKIDDGVEDVDVRNIVQQLSIKSSLPAYLSYLEPYIWLYMSEFVPFNSNKKYQQLRIYNSQHLPILSQSALLKLVPHSWINLQMYIRIINQMLDSNHTQNAVYLFNIVAEQNNFWGGEFNPYITQLYTAFCNHYVKQGDYQQAIKYYKSAMVIYIKVYPDSVFIADRHCFLAELLCALAKYMEAVRELEYGIVTFEKFCKIDANAQHRDQQIGAKGEEVYQQKQNKLLMLKFIKSTIKRSKILLKCTKNTNQYQKYSSNYYSSNQIGQIVDPLYSILNQLKQSHQVSVSDAIRRSNQPSLKEGEKVYSSTKPCLPFIGANILKIDDICWEIVQMFQIILRCFILCAKMPQITVFVGEYILNTNIMKSLALNLVCFKKVLRILLFYQIQISSVARRNQDSLVFSMLLEQMEEKGKQIKETQAYTYLYHKYIKNGKGNQIQIEKDGFQHQHSIKQQQNERQRARIRSPGGTSKKTERPMMILFLKRITESLKKIKKIYDQIKFYNLIQNHIPLSFGAKSESEQLIILLQALAALLGYDFLLSLTQNDEQEYYQNNGGSRKKAVESSSESRSSNQEELYNFTKGPIKKY